MTSTPFNDGWSYRRPTGPFAAAFGDTHAEPVTLPHDALRTAPRHPDAPGAGSGAYFPTGAYSYEKEFFAPETWANKIVRLEIEGAYRRAQIFINEEFAGNRADGYARFFVDLTPFLILGSRNRLRIEVRSGEDSRWYSGTGLHRPVHLHVDDPIHVAPDGVTVETLRVDDEQAVVEVRTLVVNAGLRTGKVRVRSSLRDEDLRAVEGDDTPLTIAPGERSLVRHRLYVETPRLWSPEHPYLYDLAVGLEFDEPEHLDSPNTVNTAFGIRTVTVDPKHGLRINGNEVKLRGACIHHDNGLLGAAAIGRAEERRVELLKAAGFNALRAAHNPLSEAMLNACDRLGMLVMDEAFDMWTKFKTPYDYAAEFPQWWAEDLRAMVAKDRNHPSVIMYSIGNEIAETGTPHGARWARRLAEEVRALDSSRLVTNGVNAVLAALDKVTPLIEQAGGLNAAMSDEGVFSRFSATEAVSTRIEESSSVLDVLGLNYAQSRYLPDADAYPHRVIVGSETFPSQIGALWPLVEANPHVIGDFTWTGWDYLGEVGIGSTTYASDVGASGRLEREFPYLTAWCGDLDITGWRRPVSYYREIVFGLRTEPYIAVRRPERHGDVIVNPSLWAWTDSISSWGWRGHEGRHITVEVYSRGEVVQLLLDGELIGEAAVGGWKPHVAIFETTYQPGELVAVSVQDGSEIGRHTLTTPSTPILTVTSDRTVLKSGDQDLAFISIEFRDDQGRLVTDSDAEITVCVEGHAQLAGLGSANPVTESTFHASTVRTFDGRALAIVRPTAPGWTTVRVSTHAGESIEFAVHVEPNPTGLERPEVAVSREQ